MVNMSLVVQQLRKELQRAENEISRFRAALSALGSPTSNGHRRTMSADARRRISLAQKARWAKQNGRAEAASPKRVVSAAARRDGGCSASEMGESEGSEKGSVTAT